MATAVAVAAAAKGQGGEGNPRRTQRWEGHIWSDKKQVYLGAYDILEQAGCAHDVMALKTRPSARPEDLNFPAASYAELLPFLQQMAPAELVSALREFSKSSSARVAASGATAASRPRKRPVPTSSATVSISSSTQGGVAAGGATGHGADSAATSQQAGGSISSPTHQERSGPAETDSAAGLAMLGSAPQPFIVARHVQGDAGLAAAAAALTSLRGCAPRLGRYQQQ
ncbi:hypothetical protein ABPG77_004193 [Micractinium sp. CCAP 211/92]